MNDTKKSGAISLRLPGELLARADALIPKLAELGAATSTGEVNRSHVLRLALTLGIAQLEQQHAKPTRGKR